MAEVYDVLIAGGGLVGLSLARALGGLGLSVALVEAKPLAGRDTADPRALALSYGARRIFEGLGLWERLRDQVAPIRQIHVSQRGRFGVVRLDAAQHGLAALGYVAEAGALSQLLADGIATRVDLFCQAQIRSFSAGADLAELGVDTAAGSRRLQARLAVAADGGRSVLREAAGIGVDRRDYASLAIVTTVRPQHPHQDTAYERFTDTGPLAVLPLVSDGTGRRCALIWTLPREQAARTLALDDRAFLAALRERFGGRLGRLDGPGPRHSFPLVSARAREQVRPRLALIGNAAHALHPVAGQGFNLGLRDVAALAEVLTDCVRRGRDPGAMSVLRGYAGSRQRDQDQVFAATEGLVRLFSNGFAGLGLARSLGLVALELAPAAKQELARRAMGLAGRLPRLARGLRPG